jgi:hypothetical protein
MDRLLKHHPRHDSDSEYEFENPHLKAGADAGSGSGGGLPDWVYQALSVGIGIAAISCMVLGAVAFGLVLELRNQEDNAHSFQFCSAPDVGVMLFTIPQILEDTDTDFGNQNRSTVIIERIGNNVHLKITAFKSVIGTMTFEDPFYPRDTFVGIDLRCAPPAVGMILCVSPCEGELLFDIEDLTTFRAGFSEIVQSFDIGVLNNPFAMSEKPFATQWILDGVHYVGATGEIDLLNTATEPTSQLVSVTMDLYYETRASAGWRPPSWCGGGECISVPAP